MKSLVKRETIDIQKELFANNSSKLSKYQDLIIGQRNFFHLIKYEVIISICSWLPGAVGLLLRSKLIPLLLGSAGRNVNFGQNVVLRHPHKIHIGNNVVIDDNCVLDAKGNDNKGIRIGDNVFIGRNTILSCKNGDIELADNVNIGFNCEIFSANKVTLGEHALLAAYCYLIGGGHDFDNNDVSVLEQGRSSKGITLGEGVWLGAGVKVMDGLTIGKHAVIGTGAVVTKPIEAYSVAMGVPAKIIRKRK